MGIGLKDAYDGLFSAVQDFADEIGFLGRVRERGILFFAAESHWEDVPVVMVSSSVPDDPPYHDIQRAGSVSQSRITFFFFYVFVLILFTQAL